MKNLMFAVCKDVVDAPQSVAEESASFWRAMEASGAKQNDCDGSIRLTSRNKTVVKVLHGHAQ